MQKKHVGKLLAGDDPGSTPSLPLTYLRGSCFVNPMNRKYY